MPAARGDDPGRQVLDQGRRREGGVDGRRRQGQGQLLGASGQSPADALELLARSARVTEVGTETIDGAQTTHYRATVDLAEALEHAGAPAEALAAVRASGVETKVPVDVWVGVTTATSTAPLRLQHRPRSGQSVSGELTMTLSDWGTDVSIDVPDDDEMLDATQLLGALGAKPAPASAARRRRARGVVRCAYGSRPSIARAIAQLWFARKSGPQHRRQRAQQLAVGEHRPVEADVRDAVADASVSVQTPRPRRSPSTSATTPVRRLVLRDLARSCAGGTAASP